MSINSYQREMYRNHLEHSERRNHKYLYKIGDRYIYPDDVAGKAKSTASNIGSMATAAGTAAKTKISNAIADQKTKLKDKKYLWDENRRKYPNLEKANVTSPSGKRVNQITSAHQEGAKKTTALSYQSTHDPISNKVVKVKRDFDSNGNQIGVGYSTESSHLAKKKQRNKIDQQRKSAHAGYEADKKNFPDGGSTEELERQKKRTAARKANKKYEEERRKINQQAQSAHQEFWDGPYNWDSVATEELKRQKERTKTRKERKEAHGTNKQRVTGKKQLDKIHNRAKAAESARNTHTDSNRSLSLSRHSPSEDKWAKELDQINSAHQGSTRKYHDNEWGYTELENRGHLTSDSVERQKHKTRLRKLRQRRGK